MGFDRDTERVQAAFIRLGYDGLERFLAEQTGKTLTQMAALLEVPAQVFVRVHNEFVGARVPPLFPEE